MMECIIISQSAFVVVISADFGLARKYGVPNKPMTPGVVTLWWVHRQYMYMILYFYTHGTWIESLFSLLDNKIYSHIQKKIASLKLSLAGKR